MDYKYETIDKTAQITAVRARIRELEQQHLQISLRVEAPDLNQPVNEMDRSNLELLQTSLDTLNGKLQELEAKPAQA